MEQRKKSMNKERAKEILNALPELDPQAEDVFRDALEDVHEAIFHAAKAMQLQGVEVELTFSAKRGYMLITVKRGQP